MEFKKILLSMTVGFTVLIGSSVSTFAQDDALRKFSNYERWWASSYVQSWSNDAGGNYKEGLRNPKFPDCKDNDCANFVSQCLWYSNAYKSEAEKKNKEDDNWEKPYKNFLDIWQQKDTWVNANALINRFVTKNEACLKNTNKALAA